jgi:hypothetical protein
LTVQADGTVELPVRCTPAQGYSVQATSDWASWDDLGSVTATEETFRFIDTQAAAFPHRFYRVLRVK